MLSLLLIITNLLGGGKGQIMTDLKLSLHALIFFIKVVVFLVFLDLTLIAGGVTPSSFWDFCVTWSVSCWRITFFQRTPSLIMSNWLTVMEHLDHQYHQSECIYTVLLHDTCNTSQEWGTERKGKREEERRGWERWLTNIGGNICLIAMIGFSKIIFIAKNPY